MKPTPPRKRAAFTLVELLVVISILSILIALCLPAVKSAMLEARLSETVGKYRQMAGGLHNYIADHDGRLPGPLSVAVFIYGRTEPLPGDAPHFGAYIAPYLNPMAASTNAGRAAGNFPIKALQNPLVSSKAQNDYKTANFITLDYSPNLKYEDNRFGEFGGTNMADARQKPIQPKVAAAVSDIGRRSPILCTADQQNWNSYDNVLLPTNAPIKGKRLYMFLDGSTELSTNAIIYQR